MAASSSNESPKSQSLEANELIELGFKELKEKKKDEASEKFWLAAVAQLKLLARERGVSDQLNSTKALDKYASHVVACVKEKDELMAGEISGGWNDAYNANSGWIPMHAAEVGCVGKDVKRFVELLQSPEMKAIPIKKFKFKSADCQMVREYSPHRAKCTEYERIFIQPHAN